MTPGFSFLCILDLWVPGLAVHGDGMAASGGDRFALLLFQSGVGHSVRRPRTEEFDGFPVTVQSADIDVSLAGANTLGAATGGEVGVDEGAHVFVTLVAVAPKLVEIAQHL